MNFNEIPQLTEEGGWECNYSINRFIEAIQEFEIEDGLEMNPDFQRGHVWTEEQQINFVEFILKGGKTGRVIYLNHPGWMKDFNKRDVGFVCVDGLQRTTAIRRFIKNEIPAFGTFYKDFEGTPRILHDMKINVNNLATKKEVLAWYLEMNEGGTPHTKEELHKVKKMIEKINQDDKQDA